MKKWVKELPHRVPLRDGVEWSWSFLTGEGGDLCVYPRATLEVSALGTGEAEPCGQPLWGLTARASGAGMGSSAAGSPSNCPQAGSAPPSRVVSGLIHNSELGVPALVNGCNKIILALKSREILVPPNTGFVSSLVFLVADLSAGHIFPWEIHGSPGLSFTLHPHRASKNTQWTLWSQRS